MEQHKIQVKSHDGFFKAILEQPGTAAALLKERLPAELVARLRLDTVEPAPAGFIDEELKASQGDALLVVKTVEGETSMVYVLIEHKSAPDFWIALQLLKYLARLYERWHTEHRLEKLPLVVPLVVYHGEEPWNAPPDFGGLLAGRKPSTPAHLDFGYAMLDLGQIPNEELSEHQDLHAGLLLLKYGPRTRERAPVVKLGLLLRAVRVESREFFVKAISYTINVYPTERAAEILEEARRIIPEEEAMFRTLVDEWKDEGFREGKAEGKADTLISLLVQRFGSVSGGAEGRIRQADVARLDAWLARFLNAKSVEEVLADS